MKGRACPLGFLQAQHCVLDGIDGLPFDKPLPLLLLYPLVLALVAVIAVGFVVATIVEPAIAVVGVAAGWAFALSFSFVVVALSAVGIVAVVVALPSLLLDVNVNDFPCIFSHEVDVVNLLDVAHLLFCAALA